MPWDQSQTAASTTDSIASPESLKRSIAQAGKKLESWVKVKAGTKVIPPPPPLIAQPGADEPPKIPSDEERLQQKREERLTALLKQEIEEEDFRWHRFADSETQVKLDIADMILEELTAETALVLDGMEPATPSSGRFLFPIPNLG